MTRRDRPYRLNFCAVAFEMTFYHTRKCLCWVITGFSGHRWRRSVIGARAEVDGQVPRTWCR